jgi:hypothetical protein
MQMKKTSLALMLGLLAFGCEKAPQKVLQAPPPDMAKMAQHMGGAAAPSPESKKEGVEEAKPEVKAEEATPAQPAAEEKPAVEEKKE